VLPVATPREVIIGRLEVEADEMWSFVAKKANKQWVWIAMDKQTRQIIAFHIGDRSHESAKQLWANLPAVYREQAMFSTDPYVVYTGVIPAAQHKAITKQARKTNHIERFNLWGSDSPKLASLAWSLYCRSHERIYPSEPQCLRPDVSSGLSGEISPRRVRRQC
jgi:insertion element IS1 protein InsB